VTAAAFKERAYQVAAADSVERHLREKSTNPCVVLPVASGKSYVIADIVRRAVSRGLRVVILAHVKELVLQNYEKLMLVAPDLRGVTGINSDGLGSRDTAAKILFAGIQSVFRFATAIGHVDLILVDEGHLLPPDGDGMYLSFINKAREINPAVRVIGFTATPFRKNSGLLCTPNGVLNEICYSKSPKELIDQGFISKPVAKAPMDEVDTSRLHVLAGEFRQDEMESLFNRKAHIFSAANEIVQLTKTRNSVLVFAAGVDHGQNLAYAIERLLPAESKVTVEQVYGHTPTVERDEIILRFREGETKYLVNCGVLTTGFDVSRIDAIAIVRATCSPGLLVQMCGRGSRMFSGKDNFLVLDFGNNIFRHGPIDDIRIPAPNARPGTGEGQVKTCPNCRSIIAMGYAECPDCGYEFPRRTEEKKHAPTASTVGILSGQRTTEEWLKVSAVTYQQAESSNSKYLGLGLMRVTYRCGLTEWIVKNVCIEYPGWPRKFAEEWWYRNSNRACPRTAEEAVRLARLGESVVRRPVEILVRRNPRERYPEILGYRFDNSSPRIPTRAAPGTNGRAIHA
jgi:DNA repair protein RadD